ncbi:MAG: heme-binding protein [Mycobacterium pseudokansasii]|uniref:SOUL family heme-binding protein n=1 Tax=Mycobacterium pseudokansasii TaxID=2341080 RepID=UPI0023F2001E|nr:heme-binding protein [Mycobacterium pseudokansasii]MBY0386936.1 heme-binding protein [Mycobacterium pseudokansasii]
MLHQIRTVTRWLTEALCSVVGLRHGTEEPRHTTEQLIDGVEIRHYGQRIAAQTTVKASEEAARNIGFRRLARYIFGGNHAAVRIAMTAPVAQHSAGAGAEKIAMTAPVSQRAGADGEWVVRFFMPADKTLESLPEPDDPEVALVSIAPETVAVRRFSGLPTKRAVASQTEKLIRALRETGFESTGIPSAWFYDPPWTIPMLRRNEVAVPVVATP